MNDDAKRCTKCGSDGPFYGKRTHSWCAACVREASKDYRAQTSYQERKARARKKNTGCCVKCGAPGPFDYARRECKRCRADYKTKQRQLYPKQERRRRAARRARPGYSIKMRKYADNRKAKPSYRQDKLRHRLRSYGISYDEYKQILEAQGGLCAICNQPETEKLKGVLKRLGIDHDHETGEVRGLLCSRCNSGLGKFKDSVELLKAAAVYLIRRRSRSSVPPGQTDRTCSPGESCRLAPTLSDGSSGAR